MTKGNENFSEKKCNVKLCIRHLKDDFSLSKSIRLCTKWKNTRPFVFHPIVDGSSASVWCFCHTICIWRHFQHLESPTIPNIFRIIERIKLAQMSLLHLRRLSNSKLKLIWLFIAALFRIHYFIPQQRTMPRSQRIQFVETLNWSLIP